jgi:hypothetical protein
MPKSAVIGFYSKVLLYKIKSATSQDLDAGICSAMDLQCVIFKVHS